MFRSWQRSLTCAGCAKRPDYPCANWPGRLASRTPTSFIGNAAGRFHARMCSRRWPRPSASPCMICWASRSRAGWSRLAASSARFSGRSPSCHAGNSRRSLRWLKASCRCTRPLPATAVDFSAALSGVAFSRSASDEFSRSPRAPNYFPLPKPRARGRRGAVTRQRHAPFPRARGSHMARWNRRQGATFDRPRCWIARRHPDRAKRSAARHGSQSAYKAGQRRPIAFAPPEFSRPLPPLPTIHSLAAKRKNPRPSHAESDQRTTRDGRRVSPAPNFSKFAEWGRTGARRRGLCSRARKIRTHCVIIKWRHGVSRGPPCRGRPLPSPAANFMSHNVLLSERANLSFLRAVGRFLAQDVIHRRAGALWWTQRRDPGRHHEAFVICARSCLLHLSGSELKLSGQRQRSLPVLPVVAARRDDRERHLTLIVPSRPDSVTNDATGRLTLSWGGAVAGWRAACPFISAGGVTARDRVGGSCKPKLLLFQDPFTSVSADEYQFAIP